MTPLPPADIKDQKRLDKLFDQFDTDRLPRGVEKSRHGRATGSEPCPLFRIAHAGWSRGNGRSRPDGTKAATALPGPMPKL